MTHNVTRLVALLAALALLGEAAAQGEGPIDQISASPLDATEKAWKLDRQTLERLYPAVARAVAAPHFLVDVQDAEQLGTRGFFHEMRAREADAIEVDGALYAVALSIASGGLPEGESAPDATSHAGADETAEASAGAMAAMVAVVLLVVLGGAGAVALAMRRR